MTDQQLDLDNYVPFFLAAAANKMSFAASRHYLKTFGIGVNEWRFLANLRISPGATAVDICNGSGIDKAAASRSLAVLEKNGYVVNAWVAPDARRRPLKLTDAGIELHDWVIKVALEREQALLAGFSSAEKQTFIEMLRRVYSNVEALDRI